MATNNVVNSFKKLTVEERAEMKEKFADVSTQIFCCSFRISCIIHGVVLIVYTYVKLWPVNKYVNERLMDRKKMLLLRFCHFFLNE